MIRPLAEATTLHVGGTPSAWIDATTRDEFIDAVRSTPADTALILGGGSNVVCADDFSQWTVIAARTQGIEIFDAEDALLYICEAGEDWSTLVDSAVDQGLAGISALAGIPGTVGAAPLQNIGAYGTEVSSVIDHVVVWDRVSGSVLTLTNKDCAFTYRSSTFKIDPTRYVILAVAFLLQTESTETVRYPALAEHLEVPVGSDAPIDAIRRAVLELRTKRGMVVNPLDHDTWSVGSFFVNPIVVAEVAQALPPECPRYPATSGVKLSAAWLIENAGIPRGYSLNDPPRAALSTTHVLAITNRGQATANDVLALARDIRTRVQQAWGITLEAEPRLVGCEL